MVLCAAEISILKGMTEKDWKTHAERAVEYAGPEGPYGPLSGDKSTKWDLALFVPLWNSWGSQAAANKDVRAHGDTMRARIKAHLVAGVKPRAFHLVDVDK